MSPYEIVAVVISSIALIATAINIIFYFKLTKEYNGLEIMDRVGGGDSFASGLIYGLMTTQDPEKSVNYGAAHGALAMTTPGDTSMASVNEVEAIMGGAGARVKR